MQSIDNRDKTRSKSLKQSKKTLLTPRTGFWKKGAGIGSGLMILASIYTAKSTVDLPSAILILSGNITLLLIAVEFIYRIFICHEEVNYLTTRYDGSWNIFCNNIFFSSSTLMRTSAVCFTLNLAIVIKFNAQPWVLWYNLGPTSLFTSLIAGLLINRILELNRGHLYDSLRISNSNGLDYGSGMAHSFFHGYLKLVIPKTGGSDTNLLELMKNYEAREHVTLECYKLFILIPKSMHCPPSLMDNVMSPSIEESKSLVDKKLDVAGVKNRSYKNSIYKVKMSNDKRVYVAAEYATPLKTFKEVFNYNENYKVHRNEITLQFFLTLRKVLKESPECGDYCDLIYYNDIKDIDDDKIHYFDVGEIILERLKEIKKRNQKQESLQKVKKS